MHSGSQKSRVCVLLPPPWSQISWSWDGDSVSSGVSSQGGSPPARPETEARGHPHFTDVRSILEHANVLPTFHRETFIQTNSVWEKHILRTLHRSSAECSVFWGVLILTTGSDLGSGRKPDSQKALTHTHTHTHTHTRARTPPPRRVPTHRHDPQASPCPRKTASLSCLFSISPSICHCSNVGVGQKARKRLFLGGFLRKNVYASDPRTLGRVGHREKGASACRYWGVGAELPQRGEGQDQPASCERRGTRQAGPLLPAGIVEGVQWECRGRGFCGLRFQFLGWWGQGGLEKVGKTGQDQEGA